MGMDLKQVIECYEKKVQALETTKNAVVKWDGKKLTKQFETFVAKETGDRVLFSDYREPRGYARFYINAMDKNSGWGIPQNLFDGIYGKHDLIHIYSHDYDTMVDDNGRLIASSLVALLDKQKEQYEEEIGMMKSEVGREKELIKQYNDLVDKIEDTYKKLSYEIKAQNKYEFKNIIYRVQR